MSDTVIEVENLSKKYIIGHQKQERYTALRDVIADGAKAFWRSLSGGGSEIPENKEEFWALKDVSFEVKQGECIGIIGRNGAGKSTLLKILSRITEPTTGRIKIRGRVASLLEVGTGFHPELTGRENIFLNGSILGMSRAEIKAKFDEIVDFAEVEKFLDTPVKFYSSGMYVRLAFAVAAYLEPEILIVDEVLAVGDAAFQKKCLGKMGDVAEKEGRTVLFVSHNMSAISSLTTQVLWIHRGRLEMMGATAKAVSNYLNEGYAKIFSWDAACLNTKKMQILKAQIIGLENGFIDVRKGFEIIIDYVVREVTRGAVVSAIIHASNGEALLSTEDVDVNLELLEKREVGAYRTFIKIQGDWLSSGIYFLRLHCGIVFQEIFDDIEVLQFELLETGNPKLRNHKRAYFLPYLKWRYEKLPN